MLFPVPVETLKCEQPVYPVKFKCQMSFCWEKPVEQRKTLLLKCLLTRMYRMPIESQVDFGDILGGF